MDDLVDISTRRYAVICVRSDPSRERLVIAYPDEKTLLGLIAEASIVALGYPSRADAVKNIDRRGTTTTSLKRLLKTAVLPTNLSFLTDCRVALRRIAGGCGFSGTSKFIRNLLHNGLAAALVFFYSKNVLSSTVRAFISF